MPDVARAVSGQERVGPGQRLVQDGQPSGGVSVVDVQRWRDMDTVAQDEREQTAAQARLGERGHRCIRLARGTDRDERLLGLAVAHELEGPQPADAADIPDACVVLGKLRESGPEDVLPSRAAAATVPSSCIARMAPTAAAQARGCPL